MSDTPFAIGKTRVNLPQMSRRIIPIWALAIVALSLALNLHALAADSFWGDEILTASFANRSPADVIQWTAGDIHPPLYYLLAGAFARFFVWPGADPFPSATSDWLWRFPSAAAGALAVAVTYRLALEGCRLQVAGGKFQNSKLQTPLFAALLLCLSPVAIKYSQEARMHALFMLWAALSTWLLLRALRRPRRRIGWLAFALATTASIYTMYFGFLILAAQFVLVIGYWLLVIKRLPPPSLLAHPLPGFSAATLLAFLLYIPWWPVLLDILRRRAAVGAIEGGVGRPVEFIHGVVNALGPLPGLVAWLFLLLFLVGLIFLTRQFWPLAAFGAAWLALPIALPLLLGDPRALQFRYAFVLPLYLTVVAYALVYLGQLAQRRFATATLASVSAYIMWVLATLSFIGALNIYHQVKPDWRQAAAYLNQHAAPADIVLFGPLWDEGRFIGYYYRGQAELLTPAALVTNIEGRAAGLRAGGGRIWAVNRFAPQETPISKNVTFSGVVISQPQIAVYEPALLTEAAISLAAQAVEAAQPWAIRAEAEGVLNPDPRTARAAALRALGDTLLAAGRPAEAVEAYQTAVDIFPGWVNGFIALAEAHEATGNLPAAVEAYRQAVAFNLKWQGAEAKKADTLIENENWSAALETYRRIIGNRRP